MVAPNEIGYFFSGDEQNTMELILLGRVAGAGISNGDYDELPDEFKERLGTFDRTITVPRQLVSTGPGLDAALVGRVRELLIDLDQTEEGRLLLEGLKDTKKFDPLPPDSREALDKLKALMDLVEGD